MMQRVISISNPQPPSEPLGERLDETIGETSTDIGNLIGKLVNRSLKAGVSNLGDSLSEYAEEQVDQAIQLKMPAITEAADEVAQSAARLVVQQSVVGLKEDIASQKQTFETKIQAAESNAFNRSCEHVDEVLGEIREQIDEARNLALEGKDASEQKLRLLRERGRRTWQKLQGEFTSIHQAYDNLLSEHDTLRDDHRNLYGEHSRLRDEHNQLLGDCTKLAKQFASLEKARQEQAAVAQQQQQMMLQQTRLLEERLALLEQPRGLKGLLAKFRSNKSTTAAQSAELVTGDAATDVSDLDEPAFTDQHEGLDRT